MGLTLQTATHKPASCYSGKPILKQSATIGTAGKTAFLKSKPMALTPQQTQILKDAQANGGTITKKEVVAMYGRCYYHNGAKHLGDILSRMVKGGLLIREKPGVFKVWKGTKNKPATIAESQQTLFE